MSTEITLFPIFNHKSQEVWDAFCDVKMRSWNGTYGIQTTDQDRNNTMAEFRQWTARDGHTFAFGAYAETQLVGYIRGTYRLNSIKCHDLYVLPEFQHMRIGRRLMTTVEQTYRLSAHHINLLAMGYSGPFYQKLGFGSPAHDDNYVKILKKTSIYGVIPVFKLTQNTIKDCSIFNAQAGTKLSKDAINPNHSPIFIYYDEGRRVDGYAIMSPDGQDAQVYASTPWAQKQLTKAIEKQKKLLAIQATRSR